MSHISAEASKAVQALKEGKVILYPTDTIWGLGCDASNEEAVKKLFEIKQRSAEKSLIILIADISDLRTYMNKVPDIAWDLVEFAEKPLTVIYPEGRNVAPSVLAQDGTIAIRLVKEDFCREMIRKFGRAITSTSANISGEKTGSSFSEIDPELKNKVNHIVRYRQDENIQAKPSTLVKLELDGGIKFLRK